MEEDGESADNDVQHQENQKVSKDCIMPSALKHLTDIALQEQDGIWNNKKRKCIDC